MQDRYYCSLNAVWKPREYKGSSSVNPAYLSLSNVLTLYCTEQSPYQGDVANK